MRALRGAREVRRIEAASARALRARAAAERTSLLAVMLAGFAWLLARHGAADVVIGVPYAGRALAGDGARCAPAPSTAWPRCSRTRAPR
ncbi:AMP-binding enzyme family protein [Burkholderia pseudomallei]|nr:AMP-binding enzyme family protein [Burkholderia pseudomallei]